MYVNRIIYHRTECQIKGQGIKQKFSIVEHTLINKDANKRQRIYKVQSKKDNPEKLATQGTKDEEKNTTQYVLDTTIRKQKQIT